MQVLVAVACCAAIAACGGKQKSAAAPGAEATSAPQVMPASPRDQIQELDDLIAADRGKLALEEPTDAMLQGAPAQPLGAMPSSADPKCRTAASDTCKTSCTLSDSICSNADKICRLAQDMAGDAWAQNKCAKANKTCEASRTKCCGCQ
jgi:hypothetical protein